jgi:hypothetical protein
MGHGSAAAGLQRQARLGAIERLKDGFSDREGGAKSPMDLPPLGRRRRVAPQLHRADITKH